jgi:lysophospholipase L1-like esterase
VVVRRVQKVLRTHIATTLAGVAVGLAWTLALVGTLAPATAAIPRTASAVSPCGASHWVGSWEAPPSDGLGGVSGSLDGEAVPGAGEDDKAMLAGGTFRLILTPHLGGSELRVHMSNRFGGAAVTFTHASIAVTSTGAGVVPGTVRPLSFAGAASVTIPAGADVVSDPVSLDVAAFQTLAVSLYAPGPFSDGITEHYTARQVSYFAPLSAGDQSTNPAATAFTVQTTTRPFLDGLDVMAAGDVGAVVALGDSITDGYGGEPHASADNPAGERENPVGVGLNQRWPDDLARRLIAAGRPLSVLDAGISGNRILVGGASDGAPLLAVSGPSALNRLSTDVLGQSSVSDVIVLEGINDLADRPAASAAAVIAGLTQLVNRLHAAGLRVQLGTLTPVGGSVDGTSAVEAARDQVNAWIRHQTLSDGIIDFDRAVADPADPQQLLAGDDSGDGLHPSPAGYQAMADAIDLSALRGPGCGSRASTPLRLRISGAPRRVRVGDEVAEHFRVDVRNRGRLEPVAGAVIRLNGSAVRTGADGRAVLRTRFARRGSYRARASAAGYRVGALVILAAG